MMKRPTPATLRRNLRSLIAAAEDLDDAMRAGFYTVDVLLALRGAVAQARISLGEEIVCPLCSGKHPISPLDVGQTCSVCGSMRAW